MKEVAGGRWQVFHKGEIHCISNWNLWRDRVEPLNYTNLVKVR